MALVATESATFRAYRDEGCPKQIGRAAAGALQNHSGGCQTQLVAAPEFRWSPRVAFVKSTKLKMPFQGVLGTEGFLDRHIVTFNKYRTTSRSRTLVWKASRPTLPPPRRTLRTDW